MGGRPLPTCSFCRKPFNNAPSRDSHERDCAMLEHGRHIPRDTLLPSKPERPMPQPSVYHSDNGRTYIPTTFVREYNQHANIHAASAALGMEPKRCSVIASRLRRRGFDLRRFDENRRKHA